MHARKLYVVSSWARVTRKGSYAWRIYGDAFHSRPPPAHTPLPAPAPAFPRPPPAAHPPTPRHRMPRRPARLLRSTHSTNQAAGGGEDLTHRKFYNGTDVIKSMLEKKIVLTIDPNELKEGVCKIYPSKDERFAVCLEDEKIKIFPIEE